MPFDILTTAAVIALLFIIESMVQFLCFTEASLGIWRTWVNSS